MYLPIFDSETVKKNNEFIYKGRNRVFNNKYSFELNQLLTNQNKKLSGLSIKRVSFPNVTLKSLHFSHVSFNGSIFEGTIFDNCKLNVVHSQNCKYYNVKFYNETRINVSNSDFGDSFFDNCIFENIYFNSNSFVNCVFWNCSFNNCVFRSSSFENAIFSNCTINNVNMQDLNIEFATIKNCKITHSSFSWYQIPYINHFFDNLIDDTNKIYAMKKSYDLGKYLSNLEQAIIFFTSQEQYFPLINLYLADKKFDYAKAAIHYGIEESIAKKDIRMIGQFGKTGILNKLLTSSDVSRIIKKLDEIVSSNEYQECEYNKILYYKIKQQLLFPEIIPHMELSIQTGYTETDLDKVGELCNELDALILANGGKATFKISHNSDPLLVVYIIQTAIMGTSLLYSIIKDFLENKKQKDTIKNEKSIVKNYTITSTNSSLNITFGNDDNKTE